MVNRSVSYAVGVSWGARLRAASLEDVRRYCEGDTALYPAMAVVAHGKPIQVGPEAIEQIQDTWRRAVASAGYIVVVGVRPHPPDKHIWGPLARAPGTLCFVGNRAVFVEWAAEYRQKGRCIELGERFEASVQAIAEAVTG